MVKAVPVSVMVAMAAACSGVIPVAAQAEEQLPGMQLAQAAKPEAVKAEAVQLEDISVSGEWLGDSSEQAVKTYAGARTVLDDTQLHQTGARNLEDALRQVPGVRVQDETGTGLLPNIGVRGLSPIRSERALILVDNVPVALAPYTGTGMSLFPVTFETVERIDVVRGGAAVHYGPNNVGGVVNIVTKPIPAKPTFTAREQLTIAESTGNILSDTYLRGGGLINRDAGLQVQLNSLVGEAERDHSQTHAHNLMVDGDWYVNDATKLKGRVQYYEAAADLPSALTPQAYDRDRTQSQRPYDAFEGKTWRGSVNVNHQFKDKSELDWTVFGHTSTREFTWGVPQNPALVSTAVAVSPRDFLVGGTEPRFTWLANTGAVDHKFTVGGRYVREEVDFDVNQTNLTTGVTTTTRDWHFDTDAYAAYFSDTLGFLGGKLKVTPGVRYEYVDTAFIDNLTSISSSNPSEEFLPGLDIGLQATQSVFLFANAHKSLRPPQVAQVVRDGDVGPEVSWNYEAGVRLTPHKSLDATLTAFRFDFEDQIEFNAATGRFLNLGETRHQGIELETNWRPDMLPGTAFNLGYTFIDTKQKNGVNAGKEVPYTAPHHLSLGASYEVDGYTLGTTGIYQSAVFSDAANTETETANGSAGKLPSYWLWNLQLTKDLAFDDRNVTLAAAVNNLFDEDYYFRGIDVSPIGRVPEPGRSFILSVKTDL